MSFEALGVNKNIIKGLHELNIKEPTKIQQAVIPFLLERPSDLVAQAQTGTGKTAAFGIPLLEKIDTKSKEIQAVIIAPTRELAQQIDKQLFKFTKYTDKVFSECVFGGEKIEKQISALRRPTHIVVATPGRLVDLIRRKAIDIRGAKTVILDEADEMLSMGFKQDLEFILTSMNHEKHIWLFSATIPQQIKYLIKEYLRPDAKHIQASGNQLVNEKIEHQFVLSEKPEKINVLLYFLQVQKDQRGIIFCNTKAAARALHQQLQARKLEVSIIEGDMQQKEREKMLRSFVNKKSQLMIATDVAARGIDVVNLAFVVHYELPKQIDYYIHRSGRTARAGSRGISMVLATKYDLSTIKKIEEELGIHLKKVPYA
ncbi:MAG: ATP-dependent RNA helicase DeaD [Marivirga sp.]|jgi:ATP-dependent RNA helicase DeaD